MDLNKNNQLIQFQKGTISISIVIDAISHVQSTQIDLPAILRKVGIQPELLKAPHARISIESFGRLWIELANQLNDEFFHMDRHAMRRGSFKLLSEMLIHVPTLDKAIEHILNFFNCILDDFNAQLFVQDNYAYIVIKNHQAKSMFCYATYIMLTHSLMCWLSRRRIPLLQIQLKCPKPLDDADYRIRFSDQIKYECDENYVQFDATYLSTPIKQDQASWTAFIQQTPYNLLVRYKNPNSLSAQIRKKLIHTPTSEWLEIHELAPQLHMSEATFQRRLKAEATSYQQIKNEIRCDIAIELLTQSSYSLQQISEALDFHDPSAFHRAFKKWTGVSPGTYRQIKSNS